MTIGLLTAFSAIMYFFVPYLSSLAIGQTVVAMAGSKMVMAPLATTAGILRMASSGGSAAGQAVSKNTSSSQSGKSTTQGGNSGMTGGVGEGRNSSRLQNMGIQRSADVQTSYAANPVRSRSLSSASGQQSSPSRVFYGSSSNATTAQNKRLGGRQQARIPSTPVNKQLTAPRALPPGDRKPRYLLGPKTTVNQDGKD